MSDIPHILPPLKTAWFKVNKRYLPVILIIAALDLLIDLAAHLFFLGKSAWEFELVELIVFLDLLLLPLAAVNTIFFFQRVFAQTIRSGWKMILLKLSATFIGVTGFSILFETIYSRLGFVDDDFIILGELKLSPSASNVVEHTVIALVIGLPIFLLQLRMEELKYKLQEKELEQARLQKLKTQAELHALQSRINPHFLFNSFNSIASLISTNATKAEQMMVQLSELFRYSLNSQESNFVTVEEELKIVETYLDIEKVRFGDNLDYQIQVDPELMQQQIPRFLIQPLVENAVKHATSKVKQGELLLEIRVIDQQLIIRLHDNGPPFPEPLATGYGLKSTFDKLQLLYPNQHQIELINEPDKHISITLNSVIDESTI